MARALAVLLSAAVAAAVLLVAVGPQGAAATLSPTLNPADYPHSLAMDSAGQYMMYWRFLNDSTLIEVALSYPTLGWVGWGIAQQKAMVPAAVVIATFDSHGVITVADYTAGGRFLGCPNGVCINSVNRVLDMGGSQTATTSIVKFLRLATTDVPDVMSFTGGPKNVIWAHGDTQTLGYHGSGNRGIVANPVNFEPTPPPPPPPAINVREAIMAHGSMMFVGFVCFLLTGAVIARYMRTSPMWIKIHMALQGAGSIIILISFILIIIVAKLPFYTSASPLLSAHAIIGLLVVVGGAILQPLWGVVIHIKRTPGQPRKTRNKIHYYFGKAILLLASINVLLGLIKFNQVFDIAGVLYSYVGLMVVEVVVLVVLEVRHQRALRRGDGSDRPLLGSTKSAVQQPPTHA